MVAMCHPRSVTKNVVGEGQMPQLGNERVTSLIREAYKWLFDCLRSLLAVGALFLVDEKVGNLATHALAWGSVAVLAMYVTTYINVGELSYFHFNARKSGLMSSALKYGVFAMIAGCFFLFFFPLFCDGVCCLDSQKRSKITSFFLKQRWSNCRFSTIE